MKYFQKIYEFIWSLCAVHYWLTDGCVNKYYDKWCRQQLKDGITFTDLTEYTVKMNGIKVWIANHPFASFRTYDNPKLIEMHPSRYTKRLLKKELDKQLECSAINYLNRLTVKKEKTDA